MFNMADGSITRMNLSSIKKIDPYAKDIVDSSSHVAFYTFNSDQNEWEKTDVEGAFFIYNRNAEPYHSIFINNRLNTTSFVEPITGSLELQSQPPFLLYRNERSRIRGFWFYNSEECDRISVVVNNIIQNKGLSREPSTEVISNNSASHKAQNTSIFNMLSKAQQEYNAQNIMKSSPQNNTTPCNVLQFFASAKHTTTSSNETPLNRLLSVDQLEKQQRSSSPPHEGCTIVTEQDNRLSPTFRQASLKVSDAVNPFKYSREQNVKPYDGNAVNDAEECLRKLLVGELRTKPVPNATDTKPALLLPTMFDKPELKIDEVTSKQPLNSHHPDMLQLPLNPKQFAQAFSYLIENDKDFVRKLHEAYLKTFTNPVFDTNNSFQ